MYIFHPPKSKAGRKAGRWGKNRLKSETCITPELSCSSGKLQSRPFFKMTAHRRVKWAVGAGREQSPQPHNAEVIVFPGCFRSNSHLNTQHSPGLCQML